jgi:dUTP pyrophosphatase
VTDALDVPVRRLDPDLPLPAYAHPGDAGADLVSAEDVELAPGERRLATSGWCTRAPGSPPASV